MTDCNHDGLGDGRLFLVGGKLVGRVVCAGCGRVLRSWDVQDYKPVPK